MKKRNEALSHHLTIEQNIDCVLNSNSGYMCLIELYCYRNGENNIYVEQASFGRHLFFSLSCS